MDLIILTITGLLILIATLIILSILFPSINIFTLLDWEGKYFTSAKLENGTLNLKGIYKSVSIQPQEIFNLSMEIIPSFRTVRIDTTKDSYYVFPRAFNFFAPAINRDLIKELKNINKSISLDSHLINYTEKTVADIYINKEQNKRGLIFISIIAIIIFIFYLFQ